MNIDLLEAIEILLRGGYRFGDALWIVLVADEPLEHARHLAMPGITAAAVERYGPVLDKLAEL